MDLDLFKGSGGSGYNKYNKSNDIKEKNYFFIKSDDLPDIQLPDTDQGKTYFGKLYITITTLQDFFTGSGDVEEHKGWLYDSFSYIKTPHKPDKTFTLPGSSLKGCVLTNLLLFLNESAVGFYSPPIKGNYEDMAKVFYSDFPITTGHKLIPKIIAARFDPKKKPQENELMKMYLKDDLKNASPSNAGGKSSGPKENILTFKNGCRFEGYINFKLLTLHQLLFLVLSLGCFKGHRFCFKLGGAKNRGMGLVRVDMDLQQSFFAHGFKELSLNKKYSMSQLEPQLVEALSRLKRLHPNIDTAISTMQKEYGVPS